METFIGSVQTIAIDGKNYEFRLSVSKFQNRWTVFQDDLDAAGKVWNSTPTFHFGTFKEAVLKALDA